jgi:ABC-type Mn2+/Zn2+ transport system ATPase subunit
MPDQPKTGRPTLISLDQAGFGYQGQAVIRDVTLEIVPGEFIGLVGANGSGKSTLFKGMLKLIPPLSGHVVHAPEILRRIGYVPQRDQLDGIYPLTAFDVARMGLVGVLPWFNFPGAQIARKVLECLEKVGMSGYRAQAFSELSGGQRQRVLIARALALDPRILVLDEPTAGIDPVAEESILALLSELNQESSITILMVSHQIQSLRHRVQRVLLIKDHCVLCGSPEELLHPDRIAGLLSAS